MTIQIRYISQILACFGMVGMSIPSVTVAAVPTRQVTIPPKSESLLVRCEFYKGAEGTFVLTWDETDFTKPLLVTESRSISSGEGVASAEQFMWEKDSSTFYLDRKTVILKIVPKDGYKTLTTQCDATNIRAS